MLKMLLKVNSWITCRWLNHMEIRADIQRKSNWIRIPCEIRRECLFAKSIYVCAFRQKQEIIALEEYRWYRACLATKISRLNICSNHTNCFFFVWCTTVSYEGLLKWAIKQLLFLSTSLPPGPRLNIKTVLSTYGDFHVKDKTAVRTSYL